MKKYIKPETFVEKVEFESNLLAASVPGTGSNVGFGDKDVEEDFG